MFWIRMCSAAQSKAVPSAPSAHKKREFRSRMLSDGTSTMPFFPPPEFSNFDVFTMKIAAPWTLVGHAFEQLETPKTRVSACVRTLHASQPTAAHRA